VLIFKLKIQEVVMPSRDELLDALPIKRRDLVLEIGGGNLPFWRTDVHVDLYISDDRERAAGLACRRNLVCADVQALPFASKVFDWVVCSQVLEHVEDPLLAISELSRVARRGYVEVPSVAREVLMGWPFHRWIIEKDANGLVFYPNLLPQAFGTAFHSLQQSSRTFCEFMRKEHDVMNVVAIWEGNLSCRIDPFPVSRFGILQSPSEGNTKVWLRDGAVSRSNSEAASWIGRGYASVVRRLRRRLRQHRYRPVLSSEDLDLLLCCPMCHKALPKRERDGSWHCRECQEQYSSENGVPCLLPAGAKPF
jgi:uncharacterized protein YbaR (Trm112 family)/SAM-dependent methyltransferase